MRVFSGVSSFASLRSMDVLRMLFVVCGGEDVG